MLAYVPRPTIQQLDTSTITNYQDSIDHVSTLLLSVLAFSFSFESHSFLLSQPTKQGYKSLPLVNTTHLSSSPLDGAKWKQFWSFEIPLNSRNTWFRILHGKVTTRRKLHSRLPDEFTPKCPHCTASPAIETTEHFLFSCPLKLEVWRHTLSLYPSPRFAHFAYEEYLAIVHFRLGFDRTTHTLFPDLSLFQVFATIQQAIWLAHYRQVFHHSPFLTSQVI